MQSPLNLFPANTVTIEDSKIDILTDNIGGLRISYNGQARLNSGHISLLGEIKSKQKKISYQAKIDGSIQASGEAKINAEMEQISLEYENTRVKRGASTVSFSYDSVKRASSLSVESHLASVIWHGLPLREVHSVYEKGRNNYNLTAEGKTFGNQHIEWSTRINSVDGVLKSETTLQPNNIASLVNFLKQNKKLRDNTELPAAILSAKSPALSINTTHQENTLKGDFRILLNDPSLEIEGYFSGDDQDDLRTIDGAFTMPSTIVQAGDQSKRNKTNFTVSSSGEFAIGSVTQRALLKWNSNSAIENGTLDYGPVKIRNLKGKISLSSSQKSKKRETLSFRLPLKQNIPQRGKVTMNIRDDNSALFEQIVFYIYGGQIRTQNRLFRDGVLSLRNKLVVSDINLDQLFDDAGFDNILISGTLGGVIPFHVKNDKIMVSGSILQSQSNGVIQLPEHMIAALFPGNSDKMRTIRQALRNYYYEFFEIRLDGDLSGRVLMTLKASGFNPTFKDREPVDLSLQIETQISILFQNLLR